MFGRLFDGMVSIHYEELSRMRRELGRDTESTTKASASRHRRLHTKKSVSVGRPGSFRRGGPKRTGPFRESEGAGLC